MTKHGNAAGVLHGWAAIGGHIGIGEDAARRRAETDGMPVVYSGRRVWIRETTLGAWLEEQEAAARRKAVGE